MKDSLRVIIPVIFVMIITLILCIVLLKPNVSMWQSKPNVLDTDLTDNNSPYLLKLNHTIPFNFEPDEILNQESVNIKIDKLLAIETKSYEEEDYLAPAVEYIKNRFNIEINGNWNYTIRYHSDNRGMIYFDYTIGEITTNKSINLSFENDTINTVYYKCLDYNIDEISLVKRLELFVNKYKQEEIKLKEDEKIIDESTQYVYFYNVDKFAYSYIVYFSSGEHEITSSYSSSYLIDKNGNATG